MSARLVWVVTCEVCDTTKEFDGSLSIEELGLEIQGVAWEVPVYGGTFCPTCMRAVKTLSASMKKEPE